MDCNRYQGALVGHRVTGKYGKWLQRKAKAAVASVSSVALNVRNAIEGGGLSDIASPQGATPQRKKGLSGAAETLLAFVVSSWMPAEGQIGGANNCYSRARRMGAAYVA